MPTIAIIFLQGPPPPLWSLSLVPGPCPWSPGPWSRFLHGPMGPYGPRGPSQFGVGLILWVPNLVGKTLFFLGMVPRVKFSRFHGGKRCCWDLGPFWAHQFALKPSQTPVLVKFPGLEGLGQGCWSEPCQPSGLDLLLVGLICRSFRNLVVCFSVTASMVQALVLIYRQRGSTS